MAIRAAHHSTINRVCRWSHDSLNKKTRIFLDGGLDRLWHSNFDHLQHSRILRGGPQDEPSFSAADDLTDCMNNVQAINNEASLRGFPASERSTSNFPSISTTHAEANGIGLSVLLHAWLRSRAPRSGVVGPTSDGHKL